MVQEIGFRLGSVMRLEMTVRYRLLNCELANSENARMPVATVGLMLRRRHQK